MRRLLQGDVGSGKTAVAAYALVRGVEAGGQGALMAPTETLATQHLIGLAALCEPLGRARDRADAAGWRPRERRAAEGLLELRRAAVAVGTHALIQAGVDYRGLRVAVVDEQHRFGVEQRAGARGEGREGPSPHVLHMTATPIPRTLALTVYGDLDVTVLDELPPGRTPVVTRVLVPGAARRGVRAHAPAAGRGPPGVRRLPAGDRGGRRSRRAAAAESEAARLRLGRARRLPRRSASTASSRSPERRGIMQRLPCRRDRRCWWRRR